MIVAVQSHTGIKWSIGLLAAFEALSKADTTFRSDNLAAAYASRALGPIGGFIAGFATWSSSCSRRQQLGMTLVPVEPVAKVA